MFGLSQKRSWVGVFAVMAVVGCGDEDNPRVGSMDCEVLGGELCLECQGQECTVQEGTRSLITETEEGSQMASGCDLFPCVDGARVIQGCSEDDHCTGFEGYWCGLGTSLNPGLCGLDPGAM